MELVQMDDDVLEAARFHVLVVRQKVWDQLPAETRAEVGAILARGVSGAKRLSDLLEPVAKVVPALMGTGLGLVNLYRGYECGRAAIADAIKLHLPELGAVAEALVE